MKKTTSIYLTEDTKVIVNTELGTFPLSARHLVNNKYRVMAFNNSTFVECRAEYKRTMLKCVYKCIFANGISCDIVDHNKFLSNRDVLKKSIFDCYKNRVGFSRETLKLPNNLCLGTLCITNKHVAYMKLLLSELIHPKRLVKITFDSKDTVGLILKNGLFIYSK